MTETPRLCVCGDLEAEHNADGTGCSYCPCRLFRLDRQAMSDQAELDDLLTGLPDMGVIIARDEDA